MRSAEFIVGPTGAAWANLVFAASGAVGMSWLPAGATGFAAYSTLGNMMGVELTFMAHGRTTTSTAKVSRAGYEVNVSSFASALDAMLDQTGRAESMRTPS